MVLVAHTIKYTLTDAHLFVWFLLDLIYSVPLLTMQRVAKQESQRTKGSCVTISIPEECAYSPANESTPRQDTISQGSRQPLVHSNSGIGARILTSLRSKRSHKEASVPPL
jgi:hypothetical protein